MSTLARRFILSAAGNPTVSHLMTRYGLKIGAERFVAGVALEDCVAATRELNRDGLAATLDLLGEGVRDTATAAAMADECERVIVAIHAEGIDANLSVKLTQLGLDVAPSACRQHVERLARRAARCGDLVRIDMEESAHAQATLDLFSELRPKHENLGIVLQAYLYRTGGDLRAMQRLGANVRLVKGAYSEPPTVAFPRKAEVDAHFAQLIAAQLESGCYTAVATHDDRIIAFTESFVRTRGIPRDRFEFQMLYGIRPARQRELAREGYRVRVYVPFGRDWYPYFVRRLAERPANLWFVAKNLVRA